MVYFLRVPFSYSIPEENRADVIEAAWEYLPLLMVSSFLAVQLECFKAYMLAYEITTPFIFIHIGTTVLHIFWCKLFIVTLSMGIKGAGIAIIITEVFQKKYHYYFKKVSECCSSNNLYIVRFSE